MCRQSGEEQEVLKEKWRQKMLIGGTGGSKER